MIPRPDQPVAGAAATEVFALVQIAPALRVLAVSPDRNVIRRELGILQNQTGQDRQAPTTRWCIRTSMLLGG